MENTAGYKVKQIKNSFFVIFKFSHGEEMIMVNKPYNSHASAEKSMKKVMQMAGVL